MDARTESVSSPVGLRADDLVEAGQGTEQRKGRAVAELAQLTGDERADLIESAAGLDGGLSALVGLRHEALTHHADQRAVTVEGDLQAELAARFAPDALSLKEIGPDAPEELLSQVVEFESVHPIRDRKDLARRLQRADRRVYALVHPDLTDELLAFVEVALGSGLEASIQALLGAPPPATPPSGIDTATFYSINNCRGGLRGIPFGRELLHRAMDDLSETTSVSRFTTLSPIPGFARWLATEASGSAARLVSECARYLLTAKRGEQPADPVARFHLGNGASLERLNPDGDTSSRGRDRSRGIMANYRYEPDELGANQTAYRRGEIVASESVLALLVHGDHG